VDFHVAKANLKKEFDLQKRCIHSNLSIIRDSVETETDFLIVLDYIPGQSLHDRIKEQGPLDEKAAIHLMLQLCDALHYLHTRPEPVYFQDVKPSNVMITEKDEAILIDFGAAAEEKEIHQWDTTILGTHGFAAPEQYSSCTDARTDIYGLGATMYYALTGKSTMEPPFEFLLVRQWQPQLSEEIEQIVAKAVMPNPEMRFQTIEQIRGELAKLR
jgi:serine/threonine-protein kinase